MTTTSNKMDNPVIVPNNNPSANFLINLNMSKTVENSIEYGELKSLSKKNFFPDQDIELYAVNTITMLAAYIELVGNEEEVSSEYQKRMIEMLIGVITGQLEGRLFDYAERVHSVNGITTESTKK